jgi:hypothetical protein
MRRVDSHPESKSKEHQTSHCGVDDFIPFSGTLIGTIMISVAMNVYVQ